ncbi:serine/threonine-protein kinase/endoribonuclease IRE1-like [Pimephales promelas]|uniref:serine/threonine-protein kinase/endoribonuclease IRE1-like n=1 Tax=Pimephales promelas TaxID=90988 RepID=UPI0019554B34|nr:serine/threonine-protein kinase/endoribonuclease IRE1-like [Pimephales promelas]XP_039518674.1 serine/threonine-protein kinase/endoribonuclease IRE1-like [Pimephales promelas]
MEHQYAEFVDTHYEALIQNVTSVMNIADKLHENRKLTWKQYSKITKTTKRTQSTELLKAVKSGGSAVKSAFCEILQEIEPDVIQELQGSFLQTADDKQVTESHHQKVATEKVQDKTDKPDDDIIRCNPSSIKHRSKIEELKKDPSKKKVSNIFFSKSNNYIIGSGGSGRVYLGLKEDGTEVAIKRITKDPLNSKDFENELKHLRDLKLESKNIVRYVDLAEDEDFYYLALQLCEYDMEDYMDNLRLQEQKDKDNALRKIVKEMLLGLQVLHHADVIHRDIKPRNVLIDSGKNARLADFGLSRKLEEGRSTVHTNRAGTRGWEATEILNQSEKSGYKKSSDIQVAGMLVYYILSDGKHPFGDMDREVNIKNGNYSLEDVQDIVAKDLIEWMINKVPAERLTVDEVLRHPFFWDDYSKDTVLRKLGDRPEIQNYEYLAKLRNLYIEKDHTEETDPTATLTIYEAFNELKIENEKKRKDILAIVGEDLKNLWKLFKTAEEATEGKTFSKWKLQLSEIWPDINKKLPEDVLGLLRVLRNKLVHGNVRNEFEENNIFGLFPDFFIILHRVAKELDWDYWRS